MLEEEQCHGQPVRVVHSENAHIGAPLPETIQRLIHSSRMLDLPATFTMVSSDPITNRKRGLETMISAQRPLSP